MKNEDKSREKLRNKPLSEAIQSRKEDFYSKIPLTLKQIDIIIAIAFAALAVVVVLIILEATGIFKL